MWAWKFFFGTLKGTPKAPTVEFLSPVVPLEGTTSTPSFLHGHSPRSFTSAITIIMSLFDIFIFLEGLVELENYIKACSCLCFQFRSLIIIANSKLETALFSVNTVPWGCRINGEIASKMLQFLNCNILKEIFKTNIGSKSNTVQSEIFF